MLSAKLLLAIWATWATLGNMSAVPANVKVKALPFPDKAKLLGRAKFSKSVKLVVLKLHNDLRRNISLGVHEGLPPASNMKQMVWSPELAKVAATRAAECPVGHRKTNCGLAKGFAEMGENIVVSSFHSKNGLSQIQKTWWQKRALREAFRYMTEEGEAFVYPDLCSKGKYQCLHFSQMIWAETPFVGCALALCEDIPGFHHGKVTTIVCNYGPNGNLFNRTGKMIAPYKKGKACSDCGQESPDCAEGLCSGYKQLPCKDKNTHHCEIYISKQPTFCDNCSPYRRQALTECRKTCGLCGVQNQRWRGAVLPPSTKKSGGKRKKKSEAKKPKDQNNQKKSPAKTKKGKSGSKKGSRAGKKKKPDSERTKD